MALCIGASGLKTKFMFCSCRWPTWRPLHLVSSKPRAQMNCNNTNWPTCRLSDITTAKFCHPKAKNETYYVDMLSPNGLYCHAPWRDAMAVFPEQIMQVSSWSNTTCFYGTWRIIKIPPPSNLESVQSNQRLNVQTFFKFMLVSPTNPRLCRPTKMLRAFLGSPCVLHVPFVYLL